MTTGLRTPGAYYERVDAGGPDVTPLRTDITGFIGIADRGPLDLPVPIRSWRQFVSWFGDVSAVGFLGYAVRGFFENGGVRCWVVRVAARDAIGGAACAAVELGDSEGPVWRLRASSEGQWGDRLSVSVREVNRVQVPGLVTDPEGRWTQLTSVAGLARHTHVRVSQAGATSVWKVASDIDPVTSRIYWVQQDGPWLTYDAPLVGVDRAMAVLVESIEYRILVSEDGRLLASYDGLSLVPQNTAYGPTVLAPVRAPVDPVTRSAVAAPPLPLVIEELRQPGSLVLSGLSTHRDAQLPLTGGRAGLALLQPYDFYGEPAAHDDSARAAALKMRGMRALESIAEIGLLAVPDALVRPEELPTLVPPPPCEPDPCLCPADAPVIVYVPDSAEQPPIFTHSQVYQVQAQLVEQCERLRYRFALLDPPHASATDAASGLSAALEWRSRFDTSHAALNYPWLAIQDPLQPDTGALRLVPPSGHVAGGYASTDLETGVHKAAANRRLSWALSASIDVDDERHGIFNEVGVNVLRTIGGRGLRVLGARTMSSDPDWRYVPVRRLMAMIEKALEIALQWVVFEPNGVFTRARVNMSVTMFLLGLHEAGMLAGASPEESFTVRCDDTNNPADQTDLGELLVEVGVAPVVPFEFIMVRVGRVNDSLIVQSQSASAGAA